MAAKTYWPFRTKLFVFIGGLFALFFLAAILLETVVVRRKLLVAETILQKQWEAMQDRKRRKLQALANSRMIQNQAKLDALLYETVQSSFYRPILAKGTRGEQWEVLASLLQRRPWVSSLELTTGPADEKDALAIDQDLFSSEPASIYEIDPLLSWVILRKKLYLSLTLPPSLVEELFGSEGGRLLPQQILRLVYDWKTLLYTRAELPSDRLRPLLERARAYLKIQEPLLEGNDVHALLKPSRKKKSLRKPSTSNKMRQDALYQSWEKHFAAYLQSAEQAALTRFSTLLMKKEVRTGNPLSPRAPLGLLYEDPQEKSIRFFPFRSVFHTSSQEEIPKLASPGKNPQPYPSALEADLTSKNAFLTKTAEIHSHHSATPQGALRASISLDTLLREIAIAAGQETLLITQEGVVAFYSSSGEKLLHSSWYALTTQSFLEKAMGKISFQDHIYRFAKIDLTEQIPASILLLEPAAHFDPTLLAIHQELLKVIASITKNISLHAFFLFVIGLLLLEQISRKMTRPITHLVAASEKIKEGDLQQALLPKVPEGSSKEVSSLWKSFASMVLELAEKEKVRSLLNKVVAKEVATELLKKDLHLGGIRQNVVVFFADIRNFTEMVEPMEPEQVIEMLNACMTKCTKVIEKYGGVVDKYVGDQVMALFGAPCAIEEPYFSALKAALHLQEELALWNAARKREKKVLVEMGIGINGGPMLAGNMGASDRLNYTVVGAHVNLAARLCKRAQGGEILVTDNALKEEAIESSFLLESLEETYFKGFSTPFRVYRVVDFS
ncbi:MAG: adenylate/guanylate cyclase domain-containing protein [Chlamydiota bacterium]